MARRRSHDPDDETPETFPLDMPSNVTVILLPVDDIVATTALGGCLRPVSPTRVGDIETAPLSARRITPPFSPIRVPDGRSVSDWKEIDSIVGDVHTQDNALDDADSEAKYCCV